MNKHEHGGSPEFVEAKTQKREADSKLRLDKEVIRTLTDQELGLVAGASQPSSRTGWL